MAKNMIDEVKKAEAKANEIISNAQTQATSGLKTVGEKADSLVKSATKEARNKSAVMVSTAEHDAYKLKTKSMAENIELAKKSVDSARVNIDKAVQSVIKEIIPD